MKRKDHRSGGRACTAETQRGCGYLPLPAHFAATAVDRADVPMSLLRPGT